ncbi:hypothetical protein [Persicitalea sp.]|uniref:hypothetical protein n=1 Tax=Persicitalea sp. TaxID=3100273 RepID=UPI00359387E8
MKAIHRKIWLLAGLLLTVLSFPSTYAQAQGRNEGEMKKIQDAKVAIITNRLSLTPEQSKDFWPIYNEFSQKKREMNRSMRQLVKGKGIDASDDQAMNSLKEVQDLKQKQVELEKEYQDRFLTVISPKQLTELYSAERDFNEMLLQRLK